MSRIEQSNEECSRAQLEITYCLGCECMIEKWWNYCSICGFHIAGDAEPQKTKRRNKPSRVAPTRP